MFVLGYAYCFKKQLPSYLVEAPQLHHKLKYLRKTMVGSALSEFVAGEKEGVDVTYCAVTGNGVEGWAVDGLLSMGE